MLLQAIQYPLFDILINRCSDGMVNVLAVLNTDIDKTFFLPKSSESYKSFIAI